IRAIRTLSERVAGTRLIVTGFRKAIWEHGFYSNFHALQTIGVEVRDYVSESELEYLYDTSTALLFLSDTEGMGLPPLEAMAKGCPVICHDSAELRETCGLAAFYIINQEVEKLADLLERLLTRSLDVETEQKRVLGFEQIEKYRSSKIKEAW